MASKATLRKFLTDYKSKLHHGHTEILEHDLKYSVSRVFLVIRLKKLKMPPKYISTPVLLTALLCTFPGTKLRITQSLQSMQKI